MVEPDLELEISAPRKRKHHYVKLLLVAVVMFVIGLGGCLPVFTAIYYTHLPRIPVTDFTPAVRGFEYEDVSFTTADGLMLSGWYIPSQNRAVIILMHAAGGTRIWMDGPMTVLARHGYGVLVFDARGHGLSEGRPMPFSWNAEFDVAAAIAYLQNRPDVDRDRIGVLGASMGVHSALQAAALLPDIKAVVAEGAGFRLYDEARLLTGKEASLFRPYWWLTFKTTEIIAGVAPGEPLQALVRRIAPRPVLFICGAKNKVECELNRIYYAAASEPKTLWQVPDAGHLETFGKFPDEYERRIVAFFDAALLTDQ